MPEASRSTERTPWAADSSAACSVSRNTIALAPSGGSGASQPCSAAKTRSAGTIASAGPPLPWPSSTDTVGVSKVTSSARQWARSEEHTSELQSRQYLVCRLLLEKKKKKE